MEFYLVYEFIFHSYDEDREETIEFFGLYENKEKAKKIANERVKKGIEEYDVRVSKEIADKENPFNETNCVEMYRNNDDIEAPIYSICIKKFKVEGKDENE